MGIFDFDIEPEFLTEAKKKRTAAEADPFGGTVPVESPRTLAESQILPFGGPQGQPVFKFSPEQARDEDFIAGIQAQFPNAIATERAPDPRGSIGGAIKTVAEFAGGPVGSLARTVASIPTPGQSVGGEEARQARIERGRGLGFGETPGGTDPGDPTQTIGELLKTGAQVAMAPLEFAIEPLDVLAETAFSLVKLKKPKGYTEALADFRERSVLVQMALGLVFDPLIIAGVLGITARTSRVLTQSAIRAKLTTAMPNVSKPNLKAATELITRRLKDTLADERGGAKVGGEGVEEVSQRAVPPVEPPTGGIPPIGPGDALEEAAESFPFIDRALEKAELFKTIDDPALVGKALERIPGVEQAIDMLRPANKRAPEVQTAWVAEGSEVSSLMTAIGDSRAQIFNEIGDQFEVKSLKGNPDVPVTFIGTEADRAVNEAGNITGTLFDIFQRPHLYDLSGGQQAVIIKFQTEHQSKFMRSLIDDYGKKVGEFDVAPGSAFLSNVDRNEDLLKAFDMTETQAIAAGRFQSRGFQTAAERMKADPTFVPVTNITQLQAGIDAAKARAMGLEVFKAGIGGETRVELIERLHPNLVTAKDATRREIQNLKARVATANRQADQITRATKFNTTKADNIISRAEDKLKRLDELGAGTPGFEEWGPEFSFLSGQVRELLAQARALESKGVDLAGKALSVGEKQVTLLTDLSRLTPQLEKLQGQYARANLGKHKLVKESGIWRYFEPKVADDIIALRETADNKFFQFLDEIRQTAFSADASPIIGVQGFLVTIANPALITKRMIGAGKASVEARDFFHVFRQDTMAAAIAENPQLYQDYSFWGGIPIGTVTEEFGAGFIGKVKLFGIGEKFSRFNESMFTLIQRQSAAAWDQNVQVLLKHGDSLDAAQMIAADLQHKVVPIWSSRRLGLNPAQAQARRAAVTSVSFISKPAELIATAANGFAKMATKQTLSSQELLATRVALSMTASLTALSISSTVSSALIMGRDPWEEVQKVIDPTSGKFMCLTIGTRCIPMGGPFRAMFKAIVPRPLAQEGPLSKFPVPFGGMPRFLVNRVTPFVATQKDLIADRDFQGGEIFPGKKGVTPENILRFLLYEFEGLAPLVAGEVIGGVRRGESPAEIAEQTGGQVAGVNILNESAFQFRDEEVKKFASDNGLTKFDGGSIDNFFDLEPRQRDQFESQNPTIFADIRQEIERRAEQNIEGFPERLRAITLREESKEQQLADDQLLQLTLAGQPGGISPQEWRFKRKDRAQDLSGQRKELFHDLDLDDPETPLDFYYEKLDEIQTEYNGVMTDAAWDELDQWQAEQTPEDQRYVDENTGLGAITPLVQEWRNDLEVLKPYFEVYENQIKPAITQGDAFVYDLWLKGSPTVRNDLTQLNSQTAPIIRAVNRVVDATKQIMIFNQPEITKRLVKWEYSVDLIKRIIAGTVQ